MTYKPPTKRFKKCRYCGTFYELSAQGCPNSKCWFGYHPFVRDDYDIIEISLDEIKISQLKMGEQDFNSKTEEEYMNRGGMTPRERWLQRFKEKK